jgi:hypothetical protein
MATPTDEQLTDPHPAGPGRFLGLAASFTHPTNGKRLRGIVCASRYVGPTARGAIPDYDVTLRGASGSTVTVSLVESQLSPITTTASTTP